MNALNFFFVNARDLIGFIWTSLRYLITFVSGLLSSKARLAARLLAAESQLAVCRDRIRLKKDPKPRFTKAFRLLWALFSRTLDKWEYLAQLMKPATVKKWHTRGYRLFWRWKSRRGRPKVSIEMQNFIRRLSRENPLWGAGRIRDTLLLLGFQPPCEDAVRKYMVRPRKPRRRSTTWLPFLRNHLHCSWAIDFFTVHTIGFFTLYVFVVFDHGRRKLVHFASTYNPGMQWIIQQLREATPFGKQPKYMFRDNDGLYGHGVSGFLKRCGIKEVRTAFHSPWQNPYIERFIGTLRRELLDHVIVLSQRHLDRLLREFIDEYYHVDRPHQGLAGDTPIPRVPKKPPDGPTRLVSIPVLGGLHHAYRRVAA